MRRPFNKYPGTDYETFNWDWLIKLGKKWEHIWPLVEDAKNKAEESASAAAASEQNVSAAEERINGIQTFLNNSSNYLPLNHTKIKYTGSAGVSTVWYSIVPANYKPSLGLANNQVDTVQTVGDYANTQYTSLSINAGIFDRSTGETRGFVIKDGEVKNASAFVGGNVLNNYIYMTVDGRLHSMPDTLPLSTLESYNPVWAVHGFHALIENGTVDTSQTADTSIEPRSFIGQNSAGDYLIAVTNGRKKGAGFTVQDIIDFCQYINFDADFLFNLDGGGSVSMACNGVRVNELINGENRPVANFISFGVNDPTFTDTFKTTKETNEQSLINETNIYYINEDLDECFSLNSESRKIAAGTDINTLTEPGVYVCQTNAIAATLSNCPVNVAFVMTIRSVYGYYSTLGYNSISRDIQAAGSTLFYRQSATSDGSNTFTFSKWAKYSARGGHTTIPVTVNAQYASANNLHAYYLNGFMYICGNLQLNGPVPAGTKLLTFPNCNFMGLPFIVMFGYENQPVTRLRGDPNYNDYTSLFTTEQITYTNYMFINDTVAIDYQG